MSKTERIIALTGIIILLGIVPVLMMTGRTTAQRDEGTPMADSHLEGTMTAPDFPSHLNWLNTAHPLSLHELRGKLVLLDFWTFCCINCMHVIPDLKRLEEEFPEELVVIGVHSAKFKNEQDTKAIRQAILRYEVTHPVVNDYRMEVWQQYAVSAWPTLVLINPEGRIIGYHSGEGIYEPFAAEIRRAIDYFERKGTLHRSPLEFTLEQANVIPGSLSFPGKVKADTSRNRLVISDSNHNRVIVTDLDGKIVAIIGSGRIGQDDGVFATASFNHPQGAWLDGDSLYIADTENHLIRLADLSTEVVTTLFGTGQQARRYNISGKGRQVALNSPWDVVGRDRKLYIAMAGAHQIWVADLQTLEVEPFAGSAREGIVDGPRAHAALAQTSGLSIHGNRLYFADSETSSIRWVDLSPSGEVKTIVGHGLFDFGDSDGDFSTARLQHPLGVTYYDGKVYVADTYNSKIKVIDLNRETVATLAGTGHGGYNDGDLADAQFFEPSGLTAAGGKLYVADANNHRIRVVDLAAGTVATLSIDGLTAPQPADTGELQTQTVTPDPQTFGEGSCILTVNVELPPGYHFTPRAPSKVRWSADDNDIIASENDPEIPTDSFPVDLAFTALPGKTNVDIVADLYYCADKSTVCRYGQVKVQVPVRITSDGSRQRRITIAHRLTE